MIFSTKTASIANIFVNLFLFSIKFSVGLIFSNLSLTSEAMNSLIDILAAFGIAFAVKINNEKPDEDHLFGHTRAESIASYTVGVLMFVLSLNIIYSGVERFFSGQKSEFGYLSFLPISVTFILKVAMFFYVKKVLKTENSPALKANLQDHKNDVVSILGVGFGVLLMNFGLIWADSVVSILLGFYILKSSIEIARESVDQLMGKKADQKDIDLITKTILEVFEVKKIQNLRTQMLGNKIQVDATVVLDSNLTIEVAHQIYHDLEDKVLALENVQDCVFHIESLEVQNQ